MHFDSFVPAMLTVFIIMTGEWIDLSCSWVATLS
jgi:hypothetical protein